MKNVEYITVQDLYAFAKSHKLLDARIRICDGMAVSYFPDPGAVTAGRYEVIIDVSANEPIGFDELDEYSMRVDPHAREIDDTMTPGLEGDALDQWAQRRYAEDRKAEVATYRRRSDWLLRHYDSDRPKAFPWGIYGYGYGNKK